MIERGVLTYVKVNQNIPFVGNCVASAVTTQCNDVTAPVACADEKCYPTFLECLQAIRRLEEGGEKVKESVGGGSFSLQEAWLIVEE